MPKNTECMEKKEIMTSINMETAVSVCVIEQSLESNPMQQMDENLYNASTEKALSCHLIQRHIVDLLDLADLLKMRAVNRQWYSLMNSEIRRRRVLSIQFVFDPLENEYEKILVPVKIKAQTPDEPSSSTFEYTQESQENTTKINEKGENLKPNTSNRIQNKTQSATKKYLHDLAKLVESDHNENINQYEFPCMRFTFTGGDLKSGGASEFFCRHGKRIDTLILSNVSPSEETLVSLLNSQAPNVVKLSLSLGLSLQPTDWLPKERRYETSDPSKPPKLLPFRVNLQPLNLPMLEVLHFGEEMQKRDWRRAVAYQLVEHSPKLKRLGNFPIFQFNLKFWDDTDHERIALFKEFTITKPQLLFPCPQLPPGMSVPEFRERVRMEAQIRAAARDRQQNANQDVGNIVVTGVNNEVGGAGHAINEILHNPAQIQIEYHGPIQEQNEVQVPGRGLVVSVAEDTGRGTFSTFFEGVRAYKDFGKFNKGKYELQKLTFDLRQKLDPSIDTTTIHTTRHLTPDFLRIFETSQQSLQILEWEYLDTIPVLPGGYPNVHRLALQVDSRPEQTFKINVARELFPNVTSIRLTHLRTFGLHTLRTWKCYFQSSSSSVQPHPHDDNDDGPPPKPKITPIESVEELELSDDFPCTRSWKKFHQLFPNLKRIKSFAAVTNPQFGLFFVLWKNLQYIEWGGAYKFTKVDFQRLFNGKKPVVDEKIMQILHDTKNELQEGKEAWIEEPMIFSGFGPKTYG